MTPIELRPIVGIMPRPGQPGALYFDGKNTSKFLKEWDMECDEYGLSAAQRCRKLPRYCKQDIGDVVEYMKGFLNEDWPALQEEMKKHFWQTDAPKDTVAALTKLIGDAKSNRINIDSYVLKYDAISESLVRKNAMSKFDRTVRLLDGLSGELQAKVFEVCSEKNWRMLEHDVETEEPDFEELKKVVLDKAKMFERKRLFVQGPLAGPGYLGAESASAVPTALTTAATTSTMPTAVNSPVSAASDGIAELTKQMSQLILVLTGQPRQPMQGSEQQALAPRKERPYNLRCIWCDSLEHTRRDCGEFTEALRAKQVGFNDKWRIILLSTGEELPVMFNRGGMKEALKGRSAAGAVSAVANTTAADVAAITYDDRFVGSLGRGDASARVTTLDFEKGVRTDEIIDVEANEKRKRGALEQTRRVRSRIEEEASHTDRSQTAQAPVPETANEHPRAPTYGYPPPVHVTDGSDDEVPIVRANAPGPAKPVATVGGKAKFRLASELNQTITTEDVGQKIMEAPIQLKMCELLAVSSEVSNYVHDQTRKRRIPITDGTTNFIATETTEAETDVVTADSMASQLSAIDKPLYACPSGRTKVCLNEGVHVEALLDDGSELNIMGKKTFDQLQHPLDSDISWVINGYDSKAEREAKALEEGGNLLGVCHDVLVDIGGVAVKQHIFVVRHASSDLILGRPWGRMTRAQMTNRDDGSYHVKIKSIDGRRAVEFIAVPTKHERIREYVRSPITDGEFSDSLKVNGVRH